MFLKACEYGIRVMIFITQCSELGNRVSLKAIASEINSPVAFTAKIMQFLTRAGLLISSRGATGGFLLPAPANKITLTRIVSAIDGDEVFTGCRPGLEKCNALKPCPLHDKFAKVRNALASMLRSTPLSELSAG